MAKIFIIDIDGTICEDIRNEEGCQKMLEALPYNDAIEQINKWFDEGPFHLPFHCKNR